MNKVPDIRKELAALAAKPENEINFSDLPPTTEQDWHGAVRGSESAIPENFPCPEIASAVAGFQPKFSMAKYEGRFYLPGGALPERRQRWNTCEELALQFVEKCRKNKTGKYSHLYETEILDQYCVRLLKTEWGSDDEMRKQQHICEIHPKR